MMKISKDMVVSFRYVMRDGRGNVLEDTTSGKPTCYLHGSAEILPLLQGQLLGLQKGEHKNVSLLQSSGTCSNDYFFEVFIEAIRPADEKELILGYPLNNVIDNCNDDCDCFKN